MSEEQTDDQKMSPEQEKRWRHVMGLRQQNMRMLAEMQQVGATTDLGVPRAEKLMDWLVDNGILTIDQRIEEQKAWELALREELQPAIQEIRQALHARGQEQRVGGLIVPGKGAQVPKVNGG